MLGNFVFGLERDRLKSWRFAAPALGETYKRQTAQRTREFAGFGDLELPSGDDSVTRNRKTVVIVYQDPALGAGRLTMDAPPPTIFFTIVVPKPSILIANGSGFATLGCSIVTLNSPDFGAATLLL